MAYKCAICGKTNIKLWRPKTSIKPLICADCAEKIQSPRKGLKIKWSKKSQKGMLQFSEGTFSKKKIPMDKWSISANGTIPSALGNDPEGNPVIMTECLKVNLTSHGFEGNITLIPAIPDENGIYLDFDTIYSTGQIDLWKQLPTR